MNLTMWHWILAIWHEFWPWWVLGILSWLAVIVDWVDKKHVAKQKTVRKIPVKIQIPVQYIETAAEPDEQPHTGAQEGLGSVQPVC